MWLSYSHCVVALLVLFVLLFGGWCGMWVVGEGGCGPIRVFEIPLCKLFGFGWVE